MIRMNKYTFNNRNQESGKVHVKVFWKSGIIISIILSVLGTIILNLIINH
jgi:hypothetical protein